MGSQDPATTWMEGQPLISYHEVRDISPAKARELVRRVLKSNGGNVSRTSDILCISRKTVRRARDGDLKDQSRRPLRSPNKTEEGLENLIVKEGRRTGFRYRRLTGYMKLKYNLILDEDTVKAILKRNGIKKRTRKAASGSRRALYDYEALMPFEFLQLDTKHLLDKSALPLDVYEHMKEKGLPQYEWNLIDACTRARFTAYSHELSATFGFMFILFSMLWLRAHNVRNSIRIRMDNGSEFCSGSQRKLNEWNKSFSHLDVSLHPIPPGAKYLNALVENSHRADDECFLIIHAERCPDTKAFMNKAQRWQDTWNYYRASYGIAMNGMTPNEKQLSKMTLINSKILKFPVLLMEDMLRSVGYLLQTLKYKSTGTYVHTTCRFQLISFFQLF